MTDVRRRPRGTMMMRSAQWQAGLPCVEALAEPIHESGAHNAWGIPWLVATRLVSPSLLMRSGGSPCPQTILLTARGSDGSATV